jgi:hypothetical protein
MIRRPGVEAFLKYVFDNHKVMVCTSATQGNAELMVKTLLTEKQREKLLCIRARQTFGLTGRQFKAKVQIYKNLEDIWRDSRVDRARVPNGSWSLANTVLIDDSVLKAKAQPHNLLQIPEFTWTTLSGAAKDVEAARAREECILRSVQDNLEILKHQLNVACQIRQWQDEENAAINSNEPSQPAQHVSPPKQIEIHGTKDYPTPTSLKRATPVEEEDEYEPPEELELVFRGRRNMHAPAVTASAPDRSKASGSQGQKQIRNQSPVTDRNSKWLSDGRSCDEAGEIPFVRNAFEMMDLHEGSPS